MRPTLALALLGLLTVLAALRIRPPSPSPEGAPAGEFSAARAQRDLAAIAGDGAPHPPGTAAHERVRALIAGRLEAMGYEVQPMARFECARAACATVTSLLVRIPGHVTGNAVMLTAHYDSVPAGPGASDDGMGVVAVLEIARALKASPTLRRPVWLFLSDGEELGLLGARSFVQNPFFVGQVEAVVNVEARGTSGPSLMFETSARDAGIVRAFAAVTAHPVASSLFPTLYAMLPNDTDLSVYKAKGIAGLNYALVGGAARYHTPRDDLAHADLGSLQHHGDNALAMVRALANAKAGVVSDDDLVFFDCLGLAVVRWPARTALPVALAALLALLASGAVAARRGLVRAREIAWGLLGVLTIPAAAAAGLAVTALLRLGGALEAPWIAHPAPAIVACASLGALVAVAVTRWAALRAGAAGAWWGAALPLAVLGAIVAARLPGLSFLFVAPATAAAAGTVAWTLRVRRQPDRFQELALATSAAAVVVWAPPVLLLDDGLGSRFVAGISVGVAIATWAAAPAVAALPAVAARGATWALAAVAALAAALALLVPRFDRDAPAHVSIRSFQSDDEAPRALLFAPDGAPDKIVRAFPLHAKAWPWSREEPLGAAPTPRAPDPAPTLAIVSRTQEASTTRTVVRLRSARGAAIVGVAVRPGADVRAVRMEGEPLAPPPRTAQGEAPWTSYECVTTPDDGVTVELVTGKLAPIELLVYDRTPGLPEGEASRLGAARGDDGVPYGGGDYAVVSRRVAIGGEL